MNPHDTETEKYYHGVMDADGLGLDVDLVFYETKYGKKIFARLWDQQGNQRGDPFSFEEYMDAIKAGQLEEYQNKNASGEGRAIARTIDPIVGNSGGRE